MHLSGVATTSGEKQYMKDLGKKLKVRPSVSVKCVAAQKSDWPQL